VEASGTSVARIDAVPGTPKTILAVLTRRNFCARAGEAVSAAMIGSLLEACGGSAAAPSSASSLPVVGGSVGSGVVLVTVDSSSPLSSAGGAVLVQSSVGNFLVARTAQDSFVALTAICTHEGCTITGFQNSRYVCPCHGSQYSTSGQVVMGPATVALRQFATQFSNNVLTISI
jgi:cytochrome b6-f complex iron-sulfur subunit